MSTPSHPGQHVPVYLGMMQHGEQALAKAYREVSERHADSAEIGSRCLLFANRSDSTGRVLQPFVQRYGADSEREAEQLRNSLFRGMRQGNLGILQDLHDLHTLAAHQSIGYFALHQAGSALKDEALTKASLVRSEELAVEQEWMNRQIREIAAQALVVPSLP